MVKKFLLVVNPVAGDLDKTGLLARTFEVAIERGIQLVLYTTTGKHDQEAIINLYKKHLPIRVLVVGGDGTLQIVVKSLYTYQPILGLIPAGSANGLAVDLGIPSILDEALAVAFSNHLLTLDILAINEHISVHLSDLGLNAALIKNYEKSSIRGKLGYIIQAMTTLADEELPFKARVETQECIVDTAANMIVIANSKKYGTGITINPLGKLNDGKFEIVILKELDLITIGRIVFGNIGANDDQVILLSTTKATISTNIPVHFQVDGEYIGNLQEVTISVLPQHIRITGFA